MVSQDQDLGSAHLGQEDDLNDSAANGSAVEGKNQEEQFVRIIEEPNATVPATAPERRPDPAREPRPLPVLPDKRFERVLDIVDYGLLTTLSEAESSRPESAPAADDSSPNYWAILNAAALSTGALPLAITGPNLSVWRRVERRKRSKRPDF